MQKGLAVMLCATALVLAGNLALAAPLSMSSPAMQASNSASAGLDAVAGAGQSGIRPAVLEIVIPNSVHRAPSRAPDGDQQSAAAKTVQWLTGPVPSRCQRGAEAAPAAHHCLVI